MGKYKLVYGVGINDASYVLTKHIVTGDFYPNGVKKQKQVWKYPYYMKWVDMLKRGYSKFFHLQNPTYKGCAICEEWLTFSNFRSWMEAQDWEGKHLDKDLLKAGNKVYSPETCCFIHTKVNTFLLDKVNGRGDLLIGVCCHRGRFQAQCNNPPRPK